MSALTSGRKTATQHGREAFPLVMPFPIADNVHIYPGAGLVLSGGYVQPATTATGLISVGRAEAEYDNTVTGHAAGALTVNARRGVFLFNNSASADLIAQTDVGNDCYWVDDQTVAKTSASSTRSRAGKICAVSSAGVEVLIGLGV